MAIAWESLLARYQELAMNVAAGVLGRRDGAEDVFQEALLALVAAERAQPGRFETAEHARNYLLKTVRNLALKRRGLAGRVEPLANAELLAERDAGEPQAWRERVERLARAVAELGVEERDLFEGRFRRHRTLAELAAETGVPMSTLHSREKALLARLRRAIEREGGPA